MNSTKYPVTAKLKAAGLWQRTCAAGNTYFAGRLGGVKILILDGTISAEQRLAARMATGRH
jgi:hypothetical protein